MRRKTRSSRLCPTLSRPPSAGQALGTTIPPCVSASLPSPLPFWGAYWRACGAGSLPGEGPSRPPEAFSKPAPHARRHSSSDKDCSARADLSAWAGPNPGRRRSWASAQATKEAIVASTWWRRCPIVRPAVTWVAQMVLDRSGHPWDCASWLSGVRFEHIHLAPPGPLRICSSAEVTTQSSLGGLARPTARKLPSSWMTAVDSQGADEEREHPPPAESAKGGGAIDDLFPRWRNLSSARISASTDLGVIQP